MPPKKKMGRPPLPKGEAKSRMLRIRCTPEEEAIIDDAAARQKLERSEWLRRVVLEAATGRK